MGIIPFVFVLYVIAFLDRINIGFAALTMNKELAIASQQFGFVQGRTVEAQEIREKFDRAWKNADVVLSLSIF